MFATLFINSAGFYVYYVLQLQKIHAEMREQLKYLPKDQLEVLHLSYREFLDARVDDHEVKVNGKMYDIARVEKSGDRITVYCVHDELEDNFLALFAELVSKPIEESSIPIAVVEFIDLNFVFEGSGITFNNSFVKITPGFFYQRSAGITLSDILTPPPKV
jgi:mRNA-degrading endonuclease RelE of RelBE toxin-antitoxin system